MSHVSAGSDWLADAAPDASRELQRHDGKRRYRVLRPASHFQAAVCIFLAERPLCGLTPVDLTHRVGRHAEVGLDVGLRLGLHRLLRLQDLLHGHVLVGAAGGLHLVLVPVLGSLALLLNSCM